MGSRLTEDITLNKAMVTLIVALLTGGGIFTGYSIRTETGGLTQAELKVVVREELEVLVKQVNHTNQQIGIIIYRQDEFSRRLERLEN